MNTEIRQERKMSPSEIVDASVIAFNAHDIHAFAAYFSLDVKLVEHPGRTKASSRAELKTIYTQLFANSPHIKTTVVQRLIVGNRVVDHERVQRSPDAASFDVVVINEIKDGHIEKLYELPTI
jgi:hypothetical protein